MIENLLLTGGSGFLGKELLELLVQDDRICKVTVLSRVHRSHSNPKVEFRQMDLSDPKSTADLGYGYDAVIHLAGLYDFERDLRDNYSQNVLSMVNLIEALEKSSANSKRKIPIYFASTYAVGAGFEAVLDEVPLKRLPTKDYSYALTKAIAERALTDLGAQSKLRPHIFRLGILVGSDLDGEIEKADGPYEFLKQMRTLAGVPGTGWISHIPIPGARKGLLPLVPVNYAARVFHAALFSSELSNCPSGAASIYGVYNTDSVRLEDFCREAVPRYFPRGELVYFDKIPDVGKVFRGLKKKTEAFRYSLNPIRLDNSRFQKVFPELKIPAFADYRAVFFKGFESYSAEQELN